MFTFTFTEQWSDGSGATIVSPVQISDSQILYDDIVVNSGVTNQQAALSIVAAKVSGVYFKSNTNLTVTVNGADSVQTITVTPNGPAVSGDVGHLVYGGNTTASFAMDTTDGPAMTTLLCALAGIGAGNLIATGPAGGPWRCEFIGALGLAPRTAITAGSIATTHAAGLGIVQTTTGVAAGQTISLLAGIPVVWYLGSVYAYPFSVDVASLFFTNTSGAQATVNLRVLNHP